MWKNFDVDPFHCCPRVLVHSHACFLCNNLQAEFDAGLVDLSEFESDVHIVTGMLSMVEIYKQQCCQFNFMY